MSFAQRAFAGAAASPAELCETEIGAVWERKAARGCLPLSELGGAASGQVGTRYTPRNQSQLLLSL